MSGFDNSREFLFEKIFILDFSVDGLHYGSFNFGSIYGCLFFFKRKSYFDFSYFGLYRMVFSIFQNVSLKALVFFQSLVFAILCAGILYFGLDFKSFVVGFVLGQAFALISLWLGKRLFGKKINLVTFGLMVFKWGVFVIILFLILKRVDRAAFSVGLFSLISFWLAFALGSR